MLAEYLGVLVILGFALALIGGPLAARLLHRDRRSAFAAPAESDSGRAALRRRAAIRFYRVALLFLAFDVAVVFFAPWAASFRETGLPGLTAITAFSLPLAVAFLYQWRKGALAW